MIRLDQTRIVIRERDFGDILDLALHVARGHALPLLLTSLVGIVPLAVLNGWLLMPLVDVFLDEGLQYEESTWYFILFLYALVLLVIWQTPLATALPTIYLGQRMFVDQIDRRQVVRDLVGSLPQLILLQVVLRGLLVPWVASWLLLFALNPYLNEIILLERNPLRRRGNTPGATSTMRRAWDLQARHGSQLFGRWVAAALVAVVLVLAMWLAMWYLRGMLTNFWELDRWMYLAYLQVAVWFWVVYFTVVRFLSYLDLRIRSEGWEIELQMRAEAARLLRQVA